MEKEDELLKNAKKALKEFDASQSLLVKTLKEKEELKKVHAKLKLKTQERANELKKSNNYLKREIEEHKKLKKRQIYWQILLNHQMME